MSSGGPTSSSSNTSPRVAAGPTTTRRRVADNTNLNNNSIDAEKQQQQPLSSSISDFSETELDESATHMHAHAHTHHHHLHPVMRNLLLRTRPVFRVPESFFLRVEQLVLWLAGSVQGLRSRKHVGRKIFAALIAMLVMSVFLKVSLLGSGVEMKGKSFKSIENGQLILQRFKEDWVFAQRVVSENGAEATSMPKRVLERLPVSRSPNTSLRKKRFFFSFCFLLAFGLKNSLSGVASFFKPLFSFFFFRGLKKV